MRLAVLISLAVLVACAQSPTTTAPQSGHLVVVRPAGCPRGVHAPGAEPTDCALRRAKRDISRATHALDRYLEQTQESGAAK